MAFNILDVAAHTRLQINSHISHYVNKFGCFSSTYYFESFVLEYDQSRQIMKITKLEYFDIHRFRF